VTRTLALGSNEVSLSLNRQTKRHLLSTHQKIGPAVKRRTNSLPTALILVGGLGKRLRSAYAAGPKPLAPVGTRPFLDYLLHWLRAHGANDVVLCVGYKRSHIQRYVCSGRKWGLRVRYSIERKPLGTAGAVKRAEEMLAGGSVLVLNGDTFLDVNLKEMIAFHLKHKGWATLAVANVANASRFGTLRLDSHRRITSFCEKSVSEGRETRVCSKQHINAGVYLFEKKLLKQIPTKAPVSLEREVFPDLLSRKKLFGFVTEGFFLDIGVPDDLKRAQSELPKRFRISDSH
jgi:D-glycero-alpha-D-manno-heptose 1-phosphate guanylyltransferase